MVVILSGGLDSLCALAEATRRWKPDRVFALTFDYGQKAKREIEVAIDLVVALPTLIHEHQVVDIGFMAKMWPNTQLTDDSVEVAKSTYLPDVVVPLRNAVFTTIASAFAMSKETEGHRVLVLGSHTGDIGAAMINDRMDAMYPDCSPEFFQAMETAMNLGHFRSERNLAIWSPSRAGMTKADLIKSGYELLGDVIFQTWSCYESGKVHCGICESCRNRRAAFVEAGIEDKTEYAADVPSIEA